ncbi:two-component system, chemotaxis family, response regulator CheB [Chryseolinea serpens]|uniref:Protein-glutamate methylesterase/protein-glutamine glutaminase n=1 Tax=Chryseolinea serpens TaxID=947013 RepID=A0A1M5X295_9BACT|nr:chemotaxis-specific protein-glutamate methyltransferase CheB [Chryseolinea serpens]SHH93860.1 two-component system, chemotaxis family, response regulator CheB [Chryseolinea serpens]
MPAHRIRTVLIDDSAFMRKVISDIINSDESIELVGVATNGQQGAAMAVALKADVVITDMVMPDYDGLYVISSIMESSPRPIILLSSLEKTDSRIFDALKYGAFEFIDKPADMEQVRVGDYRLLDLIKEASRIDCTLLKAKQLARANSHVHSFGKTLNYEIIVIGASTGGPGAVEIIINNLPKNLEIPVVIVQHMPTRFLETFTERLNENSPLPVQLARKGEMVKGGMIYIAPGEVNTRIEKNHLTHAPMFTFTSKKYDEFNYPSVDCLFESVADTYGKHSIGVILTGMGKDGTMGLMKIKEKGGYTIAQDEESSVVFGMPKAAAERGAVKQVVSLKQIPGFIVSCL